MTAELIGLKAMKIASSKCVYTNSNFQTQLIDQDHQPLPVKNQEPAQSLGTPVGPTPGELTEPSLK